MYCGICQNVFQRVSYGSMGTSQHHWDYTSILRSASQNCPLCYDLNEIIQREIPQVVHGAPNNSREPLTEISTEEWTRGSGTSMRCGRLSTSFNPWALGVAGGSVSELNLEPLLLVAIQTDHKSFDRATTLPSAELYAERVGDWTSLPSTFKQIQHWYAQCTGTHKLCNYSSNSSWCPTRLLDVGSDSDPQIYLRDEFVLTGGDQNQYITLSHRWNEDDKSQMKLLHENISALRNGIDVSQLSRTYTDAVQVARRLGVRFLWIDSLCIVQNNPDDWAKETAAMSAIYRNSTLNICAADSTNETEGCFFARDPDRVKPFRVENEERSYIIMPEFSWIRNVNESPTNRRAWVVQERVLSPRIVHFSKEQVSWECRELRASESFPNGVPDFFCDEDNFTPSDVKNIHIKDFVPGQALSEYAELSGGMELAFWQMLVRKFTRCGLTFDKDKLVALSGIAREVSSLLNTDYFAGLWRNDLPRKLLWVVEPGQKSFRPREYLAPSWSWASVNGPIMTGDDYDSCLPAHDPEWFSILDVGITLADSNNPFGQVTDGYLRVHGRLGAVSWDADQMNDQLGSPALSVSNYVPLSDSEVVAPQRKDFSIVPEGGTASVSVYLDDTNFILTPDRNLYFLPILVDISQNSWWIRDSGQARALLLVLLPCGRFARVGYIKFSDSRGEEILKCLPRKDLTII